VAFLSISRNAILEVAMASRSVAAADGGVAPEADAALASPAFTNAGLIHILKVAVVMLKRAQRFELIRCDIRRCRRANG
jgi:hypothetical protein